MSELESSWKQIEKPWRRLQESFSLSHNDWVLDLTVYLILGGLLALYLRFLYRKCSVSASDADSIARIFPLLVLVTTAVIAIVKSSLALSLGLVGALSIVRFRAAIKEPEELVYLFLCIAVGLAMGAQQPLLALALVTVATLFIVGIHAANRGKRDYSLMLTITGDSAQHFADGESGVLAAIEDIVGRYTLQRFDLENGRGQARIVIAKTNPRQTTALIAKLRKRLPDCEMSYVNMNSAM